MNTEKITAHLNSKQKEAVQTLDGPLLILAGAGSGKTRVLTHRMALLIASHKAAPEEILCLTFTNKAAREMESRIFQLLTDLGHQVFEPLWVSTFHSFCVRLLREQITLLDYKPHFSIYDDSDQLSLIKKIMNAFNINDKIYPPKAFRSKINNAKMLGLNPQNIHQAKYLHYDQKTIEVFAAYEIEMKKSNALDFGDLLSKVYDLFLMYPDVLKSYQDKFKYIMVDEYQDTNHIQYLLIKTLASSHKNLCVVGDEDQSIYSWRGADISNILDFEKDFTSAKIVKLEENYRSSKNIVTAASQVIKNNTERKEKTLFTNNAEGDLIHIHEEKNEYEEGRFVAKKIQSMMAEGHGVFSDYAVFYRTNAQSRVLEEQLRTHSIPYRLVGGVRFYERAEIKDLISYLKLSVNPTDDIALKRVINTPARGIGKTTVEKLEDISVHKKLSMFESILQACEQKVFNSGTTSKLRQFHTLMSELMELSAQYSLIDFYHLVLDKTEYAKRLQIEDNVEAQSRLQNLEELSNAMTQFSKEREDGGLIQFLEEMALVSDVDSLKEEINGVTLMTLHVSKGLEFPYVFIVGLEENLFPSDRGEEDDENEIEEERRLAYVGMTRARKNLHLTYTRTRRVWGQEQSNPPSRFLKEIPKELTKFTTAAELPSFVARFASSPGATSGNSYADTSYQSYKYKKGGTRSDSESFPDYENESQADHSYFKGMKIKHPTFGVGSVFQLEGSGEDLKVSVLFSDQTIKKFVAKYARLEKL